MRGLAAEFAWLLPHPHSAVMRCVFLSHSTPARYDVRFSCRIPIPIQTFFENPTMVPLRCLLELGSFAVALLAQKRTLFLKRNLFLLVALLLLPGCGASDESSKKESKNGETATDGPIRRDVDLGLLDDYGPPLDAARVEIARAKGWKPLPRSAPFLVQYSGSSARNNPLPRIQVTAEASSFGADELTENNLSDFLDLINTELKEQNKENSIRASNEPVAMIIGNRPCVRYVLAGLLRIGSTELSIDKQVLVTVANGRRYTLELQVLKGEIPKSRDESYAMMAGMKFAPGAAAPVEPSPDETPPGEASPSEKPPGETEDGQGATD